ncbi:hypothetical protein [Pseudomonas abietaniphila]|jgi:hypothetical protein
MIEGTVKLLDLNLKFGWIEYKPETAEDDEDPEQIYFFWEKWSGEPLEIGTKVKFDLELDAEKSKQEREDIYIATNVTATK